MEFLRNTLDVVKTIDSDNELYALEFALKGCNTLLYLWLPQSLVELLGVNANGKSANGDDLALKLDSVRGRRKSPLNLSVRETTSLGSVQYSQDARTTAQEVTCVIVSVEADQIAVKYT
jgi:hypothetical protein